MHHWALGCDDVRLGHTLTLLHAKASLFLSSLDYIVVLYNACLIELF